MTDIPPYRSSIPGRLGATGTVAGDELIVHLAARPETTHLGALRASVLAFAADSVAGVTVDDDPEQWSFTSELALRMRSQPPTGPLEARTEVLRRGRRSSTCTVRMSGPDGELHAHSVLTFAHVGRRPGDPEKPNQLGRQGFHGWGVGIEPLDRPLREAAGIEVVDAAHGVIELALNDNLLNPAGALQGAMTALVVECGAEEFVGHRVGAPVLVTELDIRYLGQSNVGPVCSSCRLLGDGPDAAVEVQLVDTGVDRISTLAYARAVPVS